MAEVLGYSRTPLAAERCLTFLKKEKDDDVLQMLALSAMRQFNPDAVEPVAQLVADDTLLEADIDWRDVRLAVVEAATIMGVSFPQYEPWYEQAQEAPWGWRWVPIEHRLADGPEAMMEAITGQSGSAGSALDDDVDWMWQLEVVLEGIEPPVWRRLELPDCPLDDLHIILQHAFGWENEHLYAFRANGVEYTEPGTWDKPCSSAHTSSKPTAKATASRTRSGAGRGAVSGHARDLQLRPVRPGDGDGFIQPLTP